MIPWAVPEKDSALGIWRAGLASGSVQRAGRFDFGRMEAIYALLSAKASYITGQCLYVDGGRLPLNFTMNPMGAGGEI